MTTDPLPKRTGQAVGRSLAYVGAGIVVLVVLTSVVVVVVGGHSTGDAFPADSPQGVLRQYLIAFDEADYAAAFAFFSSEAKAGTTLRDYEQTVRSYGEPYGGASRRVLFDDVIGDGDRVRVQLTVEEFYGGGLGGGETYRSPREVHMVRHDGEWRLDELLVWLDPAPFYKGP